MKTAIAAIAACLGFAAAKDPAEGWMGYATGTHPSDPSAKVTFISSKWKVPENPKVGGAFYSPWFGIESSDNLNLIQPVNPWTGFGWLIYNEYFQWSPVNNYNSKQISVSPGDEIYGSVEYDADNHAYNMAHADLTTGQWVNSTIPIQQENDGTYKTFNILYFVMEKSQWACDQYPANGGVDFTDIYVEFDGQEIQPSWTTAYVDDNCDCRAHIKSESEITITWDTTGGHESDDYHMDAASKPLRGATKSLNAGKGKKSA